MSEEPTSQIGLCPYMHPDINARITNYGGPNGTMRMERFCDLPAVMLDPAEGFGLILHSVPQRGYPDIKYLGLLAPHLGSSPEASERMMCLPPIEVPDPQYQANTLGVLIVDEKTMGQTGEVKLYTAPGQPRLTEHWINGHIAYVDLGNVPPLPNVSVFDTLKRHTGNGRLCPIDTIILTTSAAMVLGIISVVGKN
jgi:hypothetical protein